MARFAEPKARRRARALPQPACAGCQMRSRLSLSRSLVFHRSGLRRGRRLLCPLLTSPRYSASVARHPASILRSTGEISRGKTRYLRCIDAGFTKCIPTADGGLRSHVPACPGCTTPHIRFLFIVPQFRIGLPSDPASRQRPCPSPCLRLCKPGHRTFTDEVTRHARRAFVLAHLLQCALQVGPIQHLGQQRLGLNRLGSA